MASSCSLQITTSVRRMSDGGTVCAGAAFSTIRTADNWANLERFLDAGQGYMSGATTTLAHSMALRGTSSGRKSWLAPRTTAIQFSPWLSNLDQLRPSGALNQGQRVETPLITRRPRVVARTECVPTRPIKVTCAPSRAAATSPDSPPCLGGAEKTVADDGLAGPRQVRHVHDQVHVQAAHDDNTHRPHAVNASLLAHAPGRARPAAPSGRSPRHRGGLTPS